MWFLFYERCFSISYICVYGCICMVERNCIMVSFWEIWFGSRLTCREWMSWCVKWGYSLVPTLLSKGVVRGMSVLGDLFGMLYKSQTVCSTWCIHSTLLVVRFSDISLKWYRRHTFHTIYLHQATITMDFRILNYDLKYLITPHRNYEFKVNRNCQKWYHVTQLTQDKMRVYLGHD